MAQRCLLICRLRCLPHTRRHRQVSKKTSVAISFGWAADAAMAHAVVAATASATGSAATPAPSARHFSSSFTVRDVLEHVAGAGGSRGRVNLPAIAYELWLGDAPLPLGVPLSRLALPSPCALTIQRRSSAPTPAAAGLFEVYVKKLTGTTIHMMVAPDW
jgi:hypothetical protein